MQHLPTNTLLQGGKYKIERVLGQGGFGITYLATQVTLDKKVAIKEFYISLLCRRMLDAKSMKIIDNSKTDLVMKVKNKFLEEAQTLLIMNHPNIVKAHDVFEENNTSYYVMDFYDSGSLNDKLKQNGTMEESEAMSYFLQICGALQYLHAHNRLHLDIKPGNIMLDALGHAVLIDFGVSKHYSEQTNSNTTTLLGKSLGYAPIEQLEDDIRYFSPATDIYSLGATLYKLVIGVTPPPASSILSNGLDLSFVNISYSAKNLINACMKPNKLDRPQNISSLLSLIEMKSETTIIESPIAGTSPNELSISQCDDIGLDYWAKGNYEIAITFFDSAWSRGNLNSLFHLALCYEQKGDYLKSTSLLKIASDKGHVDAMCQLALCFEEGLGVPKNHRAAVKLCELAAKRGSLYGKAKLKGLDRSFTSLADYKAMRKAFFWFIITLLIVLFFIFYIISNTQVNYAKLINAAPAPLFTGSAAYVYWNKYMKSLKY